MELAAGRRPAMSARWAGRDTHPASLDPAGRPRIPAGTADGTAPLPRETGIVDHGHTARQPGDSTT